MSKFKYAILNGNNVVGTVWESGSREVVVMTDNKIDMNFHLEVLDKDERRIADLDLVNMITRSLIQ